MSGSAQALVVEVNQSLPMPLSGALRCEPGELLALVGPSGAGKTSMMRVLCGLMRPEHGRVEAGGEVWCDTARGIWLPPQRRHVGMVFQNYALMPHLDALQNVALSLLHLPAAERLKQARHWLDHMGLNASEQARRPAGLSGGQQQRVAVARALAREPRLLLLDEPFSAVDQMSRQSLYRLLADRLVVMDAGEVLQAGSPASIHNAPRNDRVADLVGIHNRFQGQWLGQAKEQGQGLMRWTANVVQGSLLVSQANAPLLTVRDKGRLPGGQVVSWVIPNDGITMVAADSLAPGDFAAEVDEARHLGEITLVTLVLAAVPGVRLQLTLSGAQRQGLMVGAPIGVRLNMDLVHVMPVRTR